MTQVVEPDVELNQNGQVVSTTVASRDASLMEDDAVQQGESEQPPQPQQEKPTKTLMQRLVDFYWKYDFLILLIVVVLLAKAYPPLGASYVAPKITATWIAVMYIFCKSLLPAPCYSDESSLLAVLLLLRTEA